MSGEMIQFASNGHTTPGYLALPKGDGPHPGVVMIQEWWGLVGHIKDVADRLAAQGFVVVAPDLYHGESAKEPDEAKKLAMALDRQRAILEIDAAAKYLRGRDDVQPKKIGIVGWCMGGALALSAAAHSDEFAAVVAFYGRPLEAADTAKVKAAVLGLYGQEDHGIPVSIVHDFDKELERAGVTHYVHIYAGAGHAFFNDGRPEAYHSEAAADAWGRTLAWFRQHLS